MAKANNTNGAAERKAEITRLAAENRRLQDEFEVRSELEALYRAKAPSPGDERDVALKVADELVAEIYADIHRLRADEGSAGAADRLQRMRRALIRAKEEEDVVPTRLVPAFWVIYWYLKRTGKPVDGYAVEAVRKGNVEALADWRDPDIRRVLDAVNFNVCMATVLGEHGYSPMSASNVDRILKKWRKG